MKRLLILASAMCLATPALAEIDPPKPVTPAPVYVQSDAGSFGALGGVELPTVAKGETSWSVGATFDGGIGVGLQHGLTDGLAVYIKGAKAQGEDPVGFVGVAGRF